MGKKTESPCDYCRNPKKDVHKCYEMTCRAFSMFVPKPNTPKKIIEKASNTYDTIIGW